MSSFKKPLEPSEGLRHKQLLFKKCREYADGMAAAAQEGMENARLASVSETKSSAGDKYETGRAMMQAEQDRFAGILSEARKLQEKLDGIRIENLYSEVRPGSLVITSQGDFFIAVGAGKSVIEGRNYFSVSLASPLGQKMNGLKAGDEVSLNNRTFEILRIY